MLEWPRIQVRTYNNIHGDLHVMEVALILQRAPAARVQAIRKIGPPPRAEFVIYVTLKTGNL